MLTRLFRTFKIAKEVFEESIGSFTMEVWFWVLRLQHKINLAIRRRVTVEIINPIQGKYRDLRRNRNKINGSVPVILIVFTFVVCLLMVISFPKSALLIEHFKEKGQIGDTIGGITAPLIGILNAVLLWWTLRVQNKQNVDQTIRANIEKNLEAIDRHIDKCKLTHGSFGSAVETPYNGAEALLIATTDISGDIPQIGRRKMNIIQWQAFLMSVQSILRLASVTLDLFEDLDQPHDKKILSTIDIMSQVSATINFANLYAEFILRFRESEPTSSRERAYVFEEYLEIYRTRVDEIFDHVGRTI